MKLRTFFGEIWRLGGPYWKSRDWPYAWGLLAGLVLFSLLSVHASVLFNKWNAVFYDALQNKNYESFIAQIWEFCWLLFYILIPSISAFFCGAFLSLRWRQWLTDKFTGRWLQSQSYYKMPLYGGTVDNPDQRIAMDLNTLAFQTLGLGRVFFQAILQFFSFSVILWGLSGHFTLNIFSWGEVSIPGYMMWVAIIYAVVATLIVTKVGRPLIRLDFLQENLEADFRHSLVRLRERREEVALGGQELKESQVFKRLFQHVITNYQHIIFRNLYINSWQSVLMSSSSVIPVLIAAPQFFAGVITLGILMQVANAFGSVERSVSVIMTNYQAIAAWRASLERLVEFDAEMTRVSSQVSGLQKTTGATVSIKGLDLDSPKQEKLLKGIDLNVDPGEWVLIKGESGLGKSTLFRALGGIWPFGKGKIQIPEKEVAFVPQKPYLPLGRLKTALHAGDVDSKKLHSLLEAVGLEHLISRLDSEEDWCQVLSLGEQQRLSLVRILLNPPQWLFLDEALASVNASLGRHVLAVLRDHLPEKASVVMIAHTSDWDDLFDRQIDLGQWRAPKRKAA